MNRLLLVAGLLLAVALPAAAAPPKLRDVEIALPAPDTTGKMSVERALALRRSIREYKDSPFSLAELGQLLWAAQGVTGANGARTAPSSGARYPLELHALAGAVTDLMPGVYRYTPAGHRMERTVDGDLRNGLHVAALRQTWVRDAPVTLVFTWVPERLTAKYGERGRVYGYLECGHAAQNVLLQAEALGMGAVPVGAFNDAEVKRLLQLPDGEEPLYLLPVGRK